MDDHHLLAAQRQLRRSMLDSSDAIRWRPARDLAAHMLLRLDTPGDCWRFAASWLREAFDADRVDGGFGHPDDACFRPQVEALRRDRDVPSVIDTTMNTADWGLHTLWNARGVVVLRDVELERSLRHGSRAELRRMGTRVKMAAPIMDRAGPVGLMCVDWMDACEPAGDDRRAHFEEIAAVVLGPVMGTSLRLAGDTLSATRPTHDETPEPFHSLTAAERTVARLAVDGLSYKEIARRLDRSVSTVDHQLRSARSKLGVRSTARLVNLMSGHRSH